MYLYKNYGRNIEEIVNRIVAILFLDDFHG